MEGSEAIAEAAITTGWQACLLGCPDFCFEVYRYEEPVVHELAP